MRTFQKNYLFFNRAVSAVKKSYRIYYLKPNTAKILDKCKKLCYNSKNDILNAVTEKKQSIPVFRELSAGGRKQRRFEDTFPSRYGELFSSPIRTETRYSLQRSYKCMIN